MALTLWSVMTISAGETAYLFSYFINDSKDGLHLTIAKSKNSRPKNKMCH